MSVEQELKNSLAFSGMHKSITSFDSIDLPGFVVLTGVNGSGKSHLLEAIRDGKVRSSLVSDHTSDVKLYTWETIVPKDSGQVDPMNLQSNRSIWFQQIEGPRSGCLQNLQNVATSHGVAGELCKSISMVSQLTLDQLNETLGDHQKAVAAYEALQQSMRQGGLDIGQLALRLATDPAWKKVIHKNIETDPVSFLIKSQVDFFRDPAFLSSDVDLFQQAFAQIFILYQLRYRQEIIRGSELPGVYNPSENFVASYGNPPWNFVNKILEQAGLDFRVDHPEVEDDSPYEPKLEKVSKSVGDMRFQDLSSGEKVLMSFALFLYNTQDGRLSVAYPKILLLDEVDAVLHPSMAKSLIDTIQKVLVEGQKIAVILTTHSPSTIALAPEESIYAMDPTGPRVKKVTKNKALSILTTGVPTLSIDYSGQRQVFVESKTDAKLLTLIYQRYKPHFNSDRSLSFIAVGRDKDGREQDAGCTAVKKYVNELHSSGNRSVLGLIDWDQKNTPSNCVHVLCHEIRDGIENALLDPVLVVAAISRTNLDIAKNRELVGPNESYVDVIHWQADRWQISINKLQKIVFDEIDESNTALVSIEYQSGMRLNVRRSYLMTDDHALEDAIKSKFEPLHAHGKRKGDLSQYVLKNVLSDAHWLMPKDLLVSLDQLLNFKILD